MPTMNLSTGTFMQSLPTGTIDGLSAILPITLGMPTGTQTIRADFQQVSQFFYNNGLLLAYDSEYITGLQLSWSHASGTSIGRGECYTESGNFINVTGNIATIHTGLTGSLFYHAYVYLVGSAPTVEYSLIAPASAYKGTARSKTGDTSRRYVGSILTNSSKGVQNFYHHPQSNYMGYRNFSSGNSPFRVLSAGTGTTPTAVACSAVMPPTAFLIHIRAVNTANVVANTTDDNNSGASTIALNAGNTAIQNAVAIHPVNSSQQIYYYLASLPSSGGLFIDTLGYFYER
jgi:hypothetical protein